jgi:Zn-dependent protease with chaperone function
LALPNCSKKLPLRLRLLLAYLSTNAMNFFENQDQARRNTTKLILLFGLAVALMILAFYGVTVLTLQMSTDGALGWWHPELMGLISLATIAVIGVGSASKMMALRQGGAGIARSLGGRPITPQTSDPGEMRLLNVVAEMALASGMPIPTVYLLDRETSINAFAAGFTPDDAVIGVTQGCLDQLTRDELQGVIGHEFSHIVHGDMGLNLKLIAVLQGLLLIHIFGRMVLRGTTHHRSRRDKGDSVFLLVGLSMVIIGGIGLLCGRLIKSAISRQREFLADASSVQFTRNPDGLAGALTKLGTLSMGSSIIAPNAEEASHLFFGEALSGLAMLGDWFATHPPLQERIRRIGKLPTMPLTTATTQIGATTPEGSLVMGFQVVSTTTLPQPLAQPESPSPQDFMTAIGTTDGRRLAQVQAFLQQLEPDIATAFQQPETAADLVFALLIDSRAEVQVKQAQVLTRAYGADCPQRVNHYRQLAHTFDSRQTLLLLELAAPTLKQQQAEASQRFLHTMQALIKADGQLSVSEYVLQLILRKRLQTGQQPAVKPTQPINSLTELWPYVLNLLAVLSKAGHTTRDDAFYAFKSGLYQLPGAKKRTLPETLPPAKLTDLGKSLSLLERATPKLKQAIVDACAHTVLADNAVTAQETELLRAIVIMLDCPAPPFLDARR